jgi:fructose-bisphosphate aldolase class I
MGMIETIDRIFYNYKGILATDESSGTIQKRMESVGMESTVESRHDYRHTLFSTSGISPFIGGVILFDETLKSPLTIEPLRAQNIELGIKVDKGAKDYGYGTVTEGLDGLAARLCEYRDLGATFAKWRGVIKPLFSPENVKANSAVMAIYAKRCQEADIVPIVEPEVLMDGTHGIGKSYQATNMALQELFKSLIGQSVDLEKIILKPNMVVTGYASHARASSEEVAEWTIRCLKQNVPAAVPAIAFLSGGQKDEEVLDNLTKMNQSYTPWIMSFSFGRTLQGGALHRWSEGRGPDAQKWLAQRARECSEAVGRRKEEVSNIWDSGL